MIFEVPGKKILVDTETFQPDRHVTSTVNTALYTRWHITTPMLYSQSSG